MPSEPPACLMFVIVLPVTIVPVDAALKSMIPRPGMSLITQPEIMTFFPRDWNPTTAPDPPNGMPPIAAQLTKLTPSQGSWVS